MKFESNPIADSRQQPSSSEFSKPISPMPADEIAYLLGKGIDPSPPAALSAEEIADDNARTEQYLRGKGIDPSTVTF